MAGLVIKNRGFVKSKAWYPGFVFKVILVESRMFTKFPSVMLRDVKTGQGYQMKLDSVEAVEGTEENQRDYLMSAINFRFALSQLN